MYRTSGIYPQYTLPPFYDSMIAKIIVHQPSREAAFRLMERALYEVAVDGLVTNVELLEAMVADSHIQADDYHTKWLEESFMPAWLDFQKEAEATEEA